MFPSCIPLAPPACPDQHGNGGPVRVPRVALRSRLAVLVGSFTLALASGTSMARAASIHYTVQPGDTLSAIASRYHVPLALLEQVNHLTDTSLLQVGETLDIPSSSPSGRSAATASERPTYYVVQAGDTLTSIATRFHVTVAELVAWNHLSVSGVLAVGVRLRVDAPSAASSPSPAHTHPAQRVYRVQPGDTLFGIASRLGVPLQTLMARNHLTMTSVLQPGEVLYLPESTSGRPRVSSAPAATTPLRYTVQPGDTLSGLAARFHVSLAALAQANNLSTNALLQVGQVLRVPSPSQAVHVSSPTDPPAPSLTLGQRIVEEAMRYLGVPYVWGGNTPSGFDCSGFVQFVFSHVGIALPRTASAQFQVGVSVPLSQLVPGDVVFFDTEGGVSHVGIYIGGGRFINAPATGQDVTIMSLSDPYWSSRYLGARSYFGLAG
jgi:LysM repeat protein